MNGKGSARRPAQVSDEELKARWERIFGPEPQPGDTRITTTCGQDRHTRLIRGGKVIFERFGVLGVDKG